MSNNAPRPREYTSLLREKQQELTRGRIIEAVADLVRNGQIHSFTIEEVARRAGVSYGSVYRHFPTRERLLEELYEWFERFPGAPVLPDSLDALPAWVEEKLVAYFESSADIAQAAAITMLALGLTPRSQCLRDEKVMKLIAEAAPDLGPEQVRERAAMLRYLASSLAWATLRQRFGLESGEISSALRWALEALVRDLQSYGTAPVSEDLKAEAAGR
ncbi:MAG: TetR/AcrR family transcriptional regulator [Thermoleophilia bacterium]|nr:TetR/AcrR family transcriptional regulator [Thermoleophilia bacterium]